MAQNSCRKIKNGMICHMALACGADDSKNFGLQPKNHIEIWNPICPGRRRGLKPKYFLQYLNLQLKLEAIDEGTGMICCKIKLSKL
jgi:hypothetical protein